MSHHLLIGSLLFLDSRQEHGSQTEKNFVRHRHQIRNKQIQQEYDRRDRKQIGEAQLGEEFRKVPIHVVSTILDPPPAVLAPIEKETILYAEGVIAGSPGLQCEASYPGSRSIKKTRYPKGVVADRERFGNNAFSVKDNRDNLDPG